MHYTHNINPLIIMPQVSRNKLHKKTEKELIKNLNLVFVNIGNNEEMLLFLDNLLTDTEKLMLAKRFAVVVLINENFSDTQIAEMLHMTRMTVSKIRYFYEARGRGFKIALKKLEKNKQTENLKRLLFSLARYSVRAAGGYVKPGILD